MGKVNLNKIAKEITLKEGLKKQISIAQVKEVLNIILTEYTLEDIIKMYFRKQEQKKD